MNNLPTESLLHIFSYLPIQEIVALQKVCRRFRDVVGEHLDGISSVRKLVITNQLHPAIIDRSLFLLRGYDKHRIQSNWLNGRYDEKAYLRSTIKYIPYLQLTKEYLWHSRHSKIYSYDRRKLSSSRPTLRRIHEVPCGKSDVTCFKVTDDLLISGQSDGSIILLSMLDDSARIHKSQCHMSDVNCLDFDRNIVVSGSKDTALKVHRYHDNNSCQLHCVYERYNAEGDRILSVALSPNGRKLAVGTTCYTKFDFRIFDTERMTSHQLEHDPGSPSGRAVRDVLWLSEHELLTGGFCAQLQLWDMRVPMHACVRTWTDPFEGSFFCVDADRQYSLLAGCDRHGRVMLWDTRQADFVQMYFSSTCRQNSSPVYKLSFDACQLFTATDRALNIFDFSSHRPKVASDYTYIKSYGVIR